MTTSTTVNVTIQKADAVLQLQALIASIKTLLAGVDPFKLTRETISRADLLARAQSRLDAAVATKSSRQAMHNAVAAERIAETQFKPLRAAIRSYLIGAYGPNAPELQEFGFVQNRRPKKTAATKATAVLKAKATRTARGTKGAKQKAAIKGAPPAATTVTSSPSPVVAPAAPPQGDGAHATTAPKAATPA
jgi:hypothetical protein